MILPLALLAALAAAPSAAPADTADGTLRGTVQAEPSGLPLASATVEARGAGGAAAAVTDGAGRYVLRVAAGPQRVRVRHLGHAPLEVEVIVPAGGEVELDVALEPRPLPLPALRADGHAEGAGDGDGAATPGGPLIDARLVQDGADALGAGLSAAGGEPGSPPADPGDVLFVRGSASDLKLVLLDGAPVAMPFHVAGLIRPFDAEALGGARLFLGGAPARYDGGLSYVMELRSRGGRPERHRLAAEADLLAGRLLVEGPALRGTYLVSGRAMHGAPYRIGGDEDFPYRYSDLLARGDLPLGGGLDLTATAFVNREGVRLDSLPDGFARWGNAAGSVRLRGAVGETRIEATLAASAFRARLPWAGGRSLRLRGGTDRVRAALDLRRAVGPVELRYGAVADRLVLLHDVVGTDSTGGVIGLSARSEGRTAGAYVDAAWSATERVHLRAGLRADLFDAGPRWAAISPRLAATWLLGERAALTLAGGRYHQLVRLHDPVGGERSELPADSLGIGSELAAAGATHLTVALRQEVADGLRLGLEGYHKRFDGLGESDVDASGMDLWVRAERKRITGWLGYSLGWTWAVADGREGDRFDGRQLLTGGVAGPLGADGAFAVRMVYGADLPFSSILIGAEDAAGVGGTTAGAPNPGTTGLSSSTFTDAPPLAEPPEEAYLRVDAELSHAWRAGWAGGAVLTPYLRVVNALDRRDGIFYGVDGAGEPRALASLPLLPVAGLAVRF